MHTYTQAKKTKKHSPALMRRHLFRKIGRERCCSKKSAEHYWVGGLCTGLAEDSAAVPHEVFVQAGPGYYYTDRRLFMVGSHPVVRIAPAVPMRYRSENWDFGWLMVRTDGHVVYRRCDPYTLSFDDTIMRCAVRWFVD